MSLFPRALLFGAPQLAGVRVSPDGEWITWLAPWRGAQNLWRAPASQWPAADAAECLTREAGRGVEAYRWSADGAWLIFDRDARGDERWQLCALEVASGKLVELTGGEREGEPQPSSARFYASRAARPGVIAAGLNDRDARWHDVYEIDLASGARRLLLRNDERLFAFVFDEQLRPAMALRAEQRGRTIVRIDDDGVTDWRAIDAEDELTAQVVSVDRAGDRVWWVSGEGDDVATLRVSSLRGAAASSSAASSAADLVLARDPAADIVAWLLHPLSGEPLAAFSESLLPRWLGLGEHRAAIAWLTAELGHAIDLLATTRDAARWLVARRQPDAPLAYLLVEPAAQRVVAGPALAQPALADYALAPMTARTTPARDGLPLPTYVTWPSGPRPAAGWPLLVWVHGGPWRRDSFQLDARHQWLASRGVAVLSVNFRGSTGLGKAFVNAGDQQWAAAMHTDLLDAIAPHVERGHADAARLAIAGGSFGGYAALVGLTFTPDVFACGVSICGPSDLVSSQANKPAYWAAAAEMRARRIGDPRTAEGQALLAARSPLHRVDQIRKPLLIAHGARDPRVTRSESDQVVAAAERNGVAVTYLVYGDEGHGLLRPPNRVSFYAVMEHFLAAHLGSRAEPLVTASENVFTGACLDELRGAAHVPGLAEAAAAATPPATS